jgi:nicotinamidase-related amidase
MEITSELEEILKPEKSIVLVWDVQNRLVNNIFNTDEFLTHTKTVLATARQKQVHVIFSKVTPLPATFESPVRKYFFRNMASATLKPAPGALDLSIEPADGEIVIPKNTASMFIGTNFELLLRNSGKTTIIIIGIATEYGVESTARDALNRGFFPVIISDAVSSANREGHYRSLENMKNLTIELTAEELASVWKL